MEKGLKAGFSRKNLENHINEGKERATGKKGGEEKKDSFGRFVFFFRREIVFGRKKRRPFEGGDLSIRLDMKFSGVTIPSKAFFALVPFRTK